MLFTAALLAQLVLVPKSIDRVPVPPPRVEAIGPTGRIGLKWYTLSLVGTSPANGDTDLYADTGETLDVTLTLINKTGLDLTDVVVTLGTGDPTIECVRTSQVIVGSVAAGATFTTPAFRFKVADAGLVNRSDIDQALEATFSVGVRSAQFTALNRPMGFTLSLDLNASGTITQAAFVEDFEAPSSFGKFNPANLGDGKNSVVLSNGLRCQYNDPDGPNTNSTGNPDCFPGFAGEAAENHWHIHDASAANGSVGRAYTGAQSLHWGEHAGGTPFGDTTPLKVLESVRSVSWINVPPAQFHPELIFAHQVSLVDQRLVVGVDAGEALDRAVVEVSVVAANGFDGTWKKIYPYWNEYDQTGTDDFYNCTFDPTDDGNDEDDFFDPSDPLRRLGPSSTCFPGLVFADAGNTDYHLGANLANIGRAGDGPGLAGSINVGTWVQPRFNLQEFAGRRIRLRFLASSLEAANTKYWDEYFNRGDMVGDDGWFIDDIHVSTALLSPLTVAADTKSVTTIPCGACSSITAALTATPNATATPGQPVTLDAGGTSFDVCLNGPVNYQFWLDGNENGIAGDAGDTLLRDFGADWKFVATPESSGHIAVIAQCPSAPLCDAADGSNTAVAVVTVNCPSGVPRTPFAQTIRVDKVPGVPFGAKISWQAADSVDAVRGWLVVSPEGFTSLHGGGGFTGSVAACFVSNSPPIDTIEDDTVLPVGAGYYYLVRSQSSPACAPTGSGYTTNASSERPGRDSEIEADPLGGACP